MWHLWWHIWESKFFLYWLGGPKFFDIDVGYGCVLWPHSVMEWFIDYVKCEIPGRDVNKVNTVVGIGMTLHKFTDIKGNSVYLPCVSYHLPKTDVCLVFSPQMYHQMHGGYSEVHSNCARMLLKTSTTEIQIVREEHNLPVVVDSFVSGKAKKALASNIRSGLCHTRLNALDFFHDNDLGNLGRLLETVSLIWNIFWILWCLCGSSREWKHFCCTERTLKWHWKLGIGIYRIQEMMHKQCYENPDGRATILSAIIQPKNSSARNCIVPPCQLCLLARAKKRSPKVSRTQPLEDREGAITRDKYKVWDFVSTDQFICKTPGHLPTRYGQESQDHRFQGSTI